MSNGEGPIATPETAVSALNLFESLPTELAHIVLSHLSLQEVLCFSAACRTCQRLGDYPPLWKHHYVARFGGEGVPRADLAAFERSGSNVMNYRILFRCRMKRVRRRGNVRKIIKEKRRRQLHWDTREPPTRWTTGRRVIHVARAVHTTYQTTMGFVRAGLAIAVFLGLAYLVVHRMLYSSVNNTLFSGYLP